MEKMLQTPSQTVGPYFAYGLVPEQYLYDFKSVADNGANAATASAAALTLVGKVFDGEGQVISDALVEIWQNDGETQFFGRCGTGTDSENRFVFYFQKPKPVDGQAPYLTLILFMRGQLIHSFTRVYFSDESELNATDETLQSIPAERRHTLIAQKNGSIYEFNLFMQGENETVFFDV